MDQTASFHARIEALETHVENLTKQFLASSAGQALKKEISADLETDEGNARSQLAALTTKIARLIAPNP
jgi:ribosomal protein S15P/S13E